MIVAMHRRSIGEAHPFFLGQGYDLLQDAFCMVAKPEVCVNVFVTERIIFRAVDDMNSMGIQID